MANSNITLNFELVVFNGMFMHQCYKNAAAKQESQCAGVEGDFNHSVILQKKYYPENEGSSFVFLLDKSRQPKTFYAPLNQNNQKYAITISDYHKVQP